MLLARWVSRGGRYKAELFRESGGYRYSGDGCGGWLVAMSDDDAITETQRRVDSGYFQPDANKTPMRREV